MGDVEVWVFDQDVEVRTVVRGVPRYATLDKSIMPHLVAMLIDAGFVPDWSEVTS